MAGRATWGAGGPHEPAAKSLSSVFLMGQAEKC